MKKILIVLMLMFVAPQVDALPFKLMIRKIEYKMAMKKRHREFKKRKNKNLKRQGVSRENGSKK